MRPTMSDVAAAASVSKSTVSRALSGDSRVKYETRVRIMRIAQELGYTPSFSATALARGRTWMIGVATPGTPRGFSDPFYLEFLGGLGDGAIRAGYNLLIAAPSPDEEAPGGSALMEAAAAAATETGARAAADKEASAAGFAGRSRGMDLRGIIAQGAVDAVALTEPAENDPRLAVLRQYGVPFAFLGTCEENGRVAEGLSFVDGDNIGGARAAVEHLIALGHRRIACVTGAAGLVSTRHRLEGYRQAMAAAGLPVDERWIVDGESTKAGGRRAMENLLAMGLGRDAEAPTAVFAANDVMAIGALLAAREAGLRVPDDVSIAGFDGIPMAEVVDPPLTTVQQPIYELGRKLADVILTLLEAERRKEAPVLQEIVPCRLVVRGSTAPLRARA
ncbi:MAG: hypothetical protein DIU83_04655 [Bacillota bacterium]|nr:MAG: hypothetical protein DIU83_04655 [Bacillota bacterium]